MLDLFRYYSDDYVYSIYYIVLTTHLLAVEFIENGITAKHLNLTRRQFKEYHIEKKQPPASLMENAFDANDNKVAGIFDINQNDGSVDSPALRKIRYLII